LVYSGKSALDLYNVFMQDTLKKEHRKKHKNKEMAETHLYTIKVASLEFCFVCVSRNMLLISQSDCICIYTDNIYYFLGGSR
jgi:hypothetical protein